MAGPPLVLPVGRGVPASLARLAAIDGGSVEKSGCVEGSDGKPAPLMPFAARGGGVGGGTPAVVSLRRDAGTIGGAAGGCVGGTALARANASASGETMFGGSLVDRS